MKNPKIIFGAVVLFFSSFLCTESMNAADPTFDIMNKTKKAIWVAIVAGGELLEAKPVFPQTARSTNFDAKKDLILGIYESQPKEDVSLGFISKLTGKSEITPKPDYVYGFAASAQGKTKYLTWNPEKHKTTAKYLYPQTGKFLGLLGKTEAGYSLKNNVKQEEISLKITK